MSATNPVTEAEYNAAAQELYDSLGEQYELQYKEVASQQASLKWLLSQLEHGSNVLDIGCGTGRPVLAALASAGHKTTGIDVSSEMVKLARGNAPTATVVQTDVLNFEAQPTSFDGVCAYFSLLQMSRASIRASIQRIHDWLKPRGVFAFATMPGEFEDERHEWLGREVVESSLPVDGFLTLVKEVGFEVLEHSVSEHKINQTEEETHLFIHARKDQSGS